ncbi:MAG: ABC transporter substrate-binding protein, partial [Solirubrobacteraceae bacterium]
MRLSRPMRSVPAAVATILLLIILAAPSPAPAPAQSSAAERVRLPFPAYDGTLTPYTFALGYPLVTLVYDTLLLRDAGGIPRPWLARSIERSDGGRRLTIRLRDGVRWHDRRALTAEDVAYTFRFVARHYHPRFTPQLSAVERVRAAGRLTVTIDLQRASLGFDDQPLADLPILPRHAWSSVPAGRTAPRGLPLGSGPYRLVRADPRQGYVFRANRRYFQGGPRVSEIRVPIIGDADRTYAQLRNRRVDMVPLSVSDGIGRGLASSLGIALRRGPSFTGTALVLNLREPPFNRAPARQAVAGALDPASIARSVAPAVAADHGFLHPESRWSASGNVPTVGAGAKSLPTALGAATVRVLAPRTDPVRREAGRRVVLALREAGARATLVGLSRSRLERAVGAEGTRPTFEAAIQTIPSLVSYDPDYLTQLFGSVARRGPLNVSGYSSARFDALARQVASARDPATRRRATRAELELLARDLPAIPLFFSQGTFAYRPAIYNGWVFVKGTGILDKRSFLPPGPATPRTSST